MAKNLTVVPKPPKKTKADIFDHPLNPLVIYSAKAWAKIRHLVDKCPTEIGWIGAAARIDKETFAIYDIIAPKQKATAGTFEWEAEDYAEAMDKFMAAGAFDPQDGVEKGMYNLGHSHVNMPTFSSGTDDDQLMDYHEEGRSFIIQDIHNKKGEYHVNVWDFENRTFHEDVETYIGSPLSPAEYADLNEQLKGVSAPVKRWNYYNNPKNVWDHDKRKMVPNPDWIDPDKEDDTEGYLAHWAGHM